MKRELMAGVISAVMLGATTTSAQAEPIKVKTGLWETTLHTAAQGQLPISPAELQHMSPQMRATAEKMLARGATPHAVTYKSCVTQPDVDSAANDFLAGEPGMKCSNKLSKHSSSYAAGTFDCVKGSLHDTGNFSLNVSDSAHVTGKVKVRFNNGGNVMTTQGNLSSHWVSASCGKTP